MAVTFTEFRQVGTQPTFLVFERELLSLSQAVGRPAPEIKGAKIHKVIEGDMSWLVVCTLRGGVVPPHSQELEVDVVERTWIEGVIRAMQEAIARLAHHHRQQLVTSPFWYFGRRDSEGCSSEVPQHYQLGRQMQNMEYLLHHTQTQLDRARMTGDLKKAELVSAQSQLKVFQLARSRLVRNEGLMKAKNKRLQDKVKDLKSLLEKAEAHIEELEEQGTELRKENEVLLIGNEDADTEGMDVEPESEPDDDDHADSAEEDPEAVMSEEEEDPEEPPFVEEEAAGQPGNGIIYD